MGDDPFPLRNILLRSIVPSGLRLLLLDIVSQSESGPEQDQRVPL
jgi:hypothetical protein